MLTVASSGLADSPKDSVEEILKNLPNAYSLKPDILKRKLYYKKKGFQIPDSFWERELSKISREYNSKATQLYLNKFVLLPYKGKFDMLEFA